MTEGYIDPESEQIREVFAHYGLALYRAQCLERQLAMILASKYGPDPTRITRMDFDHSIEDMFSKTLGQLVRSIKELSALNEDEEERLKNALETRNWLAHRYFWERAVELLSEAGRELMINELRDAISLFDKLDKVFTNETMEWADAFGITQQSVEREMDRLMRDREG